MPNGNSDAATRTQQKYISELDDLSGVSTYNLTLNVYDRDFFRAMIQDLGATSPESKLESHALITASHNYFKEMLGRKATDLGQGKPLIEWLLRIRKILTDQMSVVVVSSDDEDNAATIFETLNDRGIGLSAPDLLRNFLLQRADPTQREEIIDCWRDVLAIEEDAKVEDFLRHYWLSLKGDVKTRSLYREIKQTFLDDHLDALTFSRQLREASGLYSDVVAAREDDADCRERLSDVREFGARFLIPAILSSYAAGNLDARRKFLKTLIAAYVRYVVIGGREGSKFETVAYQLASKLRANKDFAAAASALNAIVPKDPQFEQDLKEVRISRARIARCVLRQVEASYWNTDEVGARGDVARVNLEHIYPEKPSGTRLKDHEQWVNRLGNLTLLGKPLNRDLKNAEFAAKKVAYAQSELRMTKALAELSAWNEVAIVKRQEEMTSRALKIWSFPSV